MKNISRFTVLLTFGLVSRVQEASAIDARSEPFTEIQPNGDKVILRLIGDESDHSLVDLEGYSVERNEEGEYVYVDESDDGEAYITTERVGQSNPGSKGMKKGAKVPKDCTKKICGHPELDEEYFFEPYAIKGASRRRGAQTTGTLKNLVVLIRWKDHDKRKLPSMTEIDTLMNAEEPDEQLCKTGSLKGVYKEISHGQLTIESTVTPWITVSNTEAWYADGSSGTTNLHEALREALTHLEKNSVVNFEDFDEDNDGFIDSITFLHSGYGAEWGMPDCNNVDRADRIWSHKWSIWSDRSGQRTGPWKSKTKVTVEKYHISPALWGTCGSEIGRVGVIAHETGHFLGIPDLYDRDRGGKGLGGFCLMASSWGFDGSQYYPGFPSAWTRVQLGWTTPAIPAAGENLVAHAERPSDDGNPQVYIIGKEFGFPDGEYLLIENRQKYGLDSLLPRGGLAIYHIDEKADLDNEGHPGQTGWPQNGNHYRVALLQADGFYNLERGDNKGGSRDFFHLDDINELLPSLDPNRGPFPNTDAYQGGKVLQTGVEIFDISASGDTMSFHFSHPEARAILAPPTGEPSISPVSTSPSTSQQPSDLPSYFPSTSPSNSPSLTPSAGPTATLEPTITSMVPSFLPSATPTFQCREKKEECTQDNQCCSGECKIREKGGVIEQKCK